MKIFAKKRLSIFLISFFIFLQGCSSSAPVTQQYYILSTSANADVSMVSGKPIMSIRRVKLPKYLEREGIARKLEDEKIAVSFRSLWAERLSESIPKILAKEIESIVKEPIEVHPLPPGHRVDVILEVDIYKLLGDKTNLTLQAKYRLLKQKSMVSNNFETVVPLADEKVATLVEAHNEALQSLAEEIANKL